MAAVPLGGQEPGLTPGGLVWQVHTEPAAATALVGRALRHEDPAVRAVAARLVGTTRATDLTGALMDALRAERISPPAAEQVRALLLLGSPDALDAVNRHLVHGGGPAYRAYIGYLANRNPARLGHELPDLIEPLTEKSEGNLAYQVVVAALQHPDQATALMQEWVRVAPPASWRSLLERYPFQPDNADHMALLRSALVSPVEATRAETVWQVMDWTLGGVKLPAEILEAATDLAFVESESVTWEQLGREWLSRVHFDRTTPDRADVLPAFWDRLRSELRRHATALRLNPAERKALVRLDPNSVSARSPLQPPERVTAVRTFPWPSARFYSTLLAASGCRLDGQPRIGSLRVTYSADGRPASIRPDRGSLAPSCDAMLLAAAKVLLKSDDDAVPTGMEQTVVVPAIREWAPCADLEPLSEAERSSASGLDPNQLVTEPRKIRNVDPVRPRDAARQPLRGSGLYEARVAKIGCVNEVRSRRSAGVPLDLSSIAAALRWRYAPGRVDNTPVDARVTFTVNYQ